MSEPSRLLVIVNNAAARARASAPVVRAALGRAGVPFELRESVRPGETEEEARAAFASGVGTVAVVGGDGTLSAAAAGYFEPCGEVGGDEPPRAVNASSSLAVLPAGTGDDFARGLTGGKREPLEAWLGRLVEHFRREAFDGGRRVDVLLGSVDAGARRFVCLNAATLGVGAEVAARVGAQGPRVRRLPGEARFALASVRSLAGWRNRAVRVEVDGRVWLECGTNLLAVVNGTYAGGGMNFSPEASLTDGLLDVLAVCGISRAGLVRELTRVHRGGHLANPKVKLTRGRRVRVEAETDQLPVEADGDARGHTPAEFRVMPAAMRVVF
jgi:diacylglycerol kinase (ATP)